MGAWIEICAGAIAVPDVGSLPLWERGLKYPVLYNTAYLQYVAPLVGAWIEILFLHNSSKVLRVAPLVGAWIEM